MIKELNQLCLICRGPILSRLQVFITFFISNYISTHFFLVVIHLLYFIINNSALI